MRISIVVNGVFHAPQLASELYRREALAEVVSAHPAFLLRNFGFPRRLIRPARKSMRRHGALPRLLRLSADVRKKSGDVHNLFDLEAARLVSSSSDLVVAWSGSCQKVLSLCKSRGQSCVVERGSTHILAQRAILQEQVERTGNDLIGLPDQRAVERELAEYELAEKIFVPSMFAYQSFLNHGVDIGKLAVVPYGVDSKFFSPRRDRYECSHGRFVVSHVGGLTYRKGIDTLIRAVEMLADEDVELRLFGDVTPEAQDLLRNTSARITHIGAVSKRRLCAHMNESTAIVLASVEEGLSLALLEAMACGTPVICTPNTGVAEHITDGHDGFVVPVGDSGAIAQRIIQLKQERDRAEAVGRAAREMAERFSWSRYGAQMMSEYETLVR